MRKFVLLLALLVSKSAFAFGSGEHVFYIQDNIPQEGKIISMSGSSGGSGLARIEFFSPPMPTSPVEIPTSQLIPHLKGHPMLAEYHSEGHTFTGEVVGILEGKAIVQFNTWLMPTHPILVPLGQLRMLGR